MPTDAADAPTPPRTRLRLIGGVNFPTWPDLKWARANTHVAALHASFGEWHASAPVSIEGVLNATGTGIDLVARVPRGIPKHEWALTLGDALHNLRSAFDAVAWGMAHFDDAKPAKPRRVQFPICENEKSWDEAVKSWIGELDSEFQERLHLMQPYKFAAGQDTVLKTLHDLDVIDKHREMLTVSADLHSVNLEGAFEYTEDHTTATPRVEMRSDVKFGDGVTLGTIQAGASIRMAGQMILRPSMQVQLSYGETTFDVLGLLQLLIPEARRYLDILMQGLDEPPDGKAEWLPIEVTPPRRPLL